MELYGYACGQWSASPPFLLPASAPFNITNLPAPQGNFPIPFPSHSRTSKNRNASTQSQFHKSTEYEGEAKDAITKSDKTKRRKAAGKIQAGRESEEKKTDGGRGSFSFRSLTSTALSPRAPFPKERKSFPCSRKTPLLCIFVLMAITTNPCAKQHLESQCRYSPLSPSTRTH